MAKEKRPVADLDAELAALEAELAALEGRKPAPRKTTPPATAPAPAHEPAPGPAEAPAPAAAEERKARFGFGRRKEDAHPEESPAEAALPAEARKPRFGFGRKKDAEKAAPAAVEPTPSAEEAPRSRGLPTFGRRKADAPGEAPAEDASATRVDVMPEAAPVMPAPLPAAAPAPRRAPSIPVTDPTPWRQEESGAWVRVVPGSAKPVVRRILDEEDRVVREEPADEAALHETSGAADGEKGFGRLFRRRS